MFGFGGDGDMDFVETVSAAGFLGAYVDEATRDSEKSKKKKKQKKQKRDSSCWPWDDDYDSDDDDVWDDDEDDWDYEDPDDISKVDSTDAFDVMEAVTSSRYDWDDIETLVGDALDNGVTFSENNAEEICRRIFDPDLMFRVRCSGKD